MSEPDLLQRQRQTMRAFREAEADRKAREADAESKRASAVSEAERDAKAGLGAASTVVARLESAQVEAKQELGKIQQSLPEEVAYAKPEHSGRPAMELERSANIAQAEMVQLRRAVSALQARTAQDTIRRTAFAAVVAGSCLILLVAAAIAYRPIMLAWHLQQAAAAMQAEEWDRARSEAELVLTLDQSNSDASNWIRESSYNAALAALESKDWEKVREELAFLTALEPNYRDADILLRESYFRAAQEAIDAQQWEIARGQLEDLLKIDPDYRSASTLLLESYYQEAVAEIGSQNWDAARIELELLDQIGPGYKDSLVLLQEAYYQLALAAKEDGSWVAAAQYIIKFRTLSADDRDIANWLVASSELQGAFTKEVWLNHEIVSRTLATVNALTWRIDIAPESRLLSLSLENGLVVVYDTRTGELVHRFSPSVSPQAPAFTVVFSPTGETVAIGYHSRISLWTVSTDELILDWIAHDDSIHALAFSPDGQTLISGSLDGTVKVWDLPSGALKATWEIGNSVWSVQIGPNGEYVAIGDLNGTIELYSLSTGQRVGTLAEQSGIIWDLAFSPNGQWLASASSDQTVAIWSLATRALEIKLAEFKYQVFSVSWDPTSTLLATGSDDVKLWDSANWQLVRTLTDASTFYRREVTFSPNGLFLASSSNKLVTIWQTGLP